MTHFIEYHYFNPLGVVAGPINQCYVESIFIIYGKHYTAFLSKNILITWAKSIYSIYSQAAWLLYGQFSTMDDASTGHPYVGSWYYKNYFL